MKTKGKTGREPVRLLHTADLHVGKPFHDFPGDRGARLRENRLEMLARIGDLARSEQVDLVLVAGDFFDSNTVDERTVSAACARIQDAHVPFIVIPGNHDACAGPDSIYRRPSFRNLRPENLIVLAERTPVVLLDGRLAILPAPCLYRRSAEDTTAHFAESRDHDAALAAVRIGLAHGSIVGFERDDEGASLNLIPEGRAKSAALDYLALGDWHGTKQVDERTWYSGTPEPTSFKDNGQGNVLLVTVEAPGAHPLVERRALARTTFLRREYELRTPEDVSRMAGDLESVKGSGDIVLEVVLRGDLHTSATTRVRQILNDSDGRFLAVRASIDGLRERTSEADLSSITPDGFVRTAAERLLQQSRADGDGGRPAMLALRVLNQFATDLEGSSC